MKSIAVSFILWYLRSIARFSLWLNRPTVIGIAGSVGKSSTRNSVYAALRDSVQVKMVSGNSETGLPLGLLGIKPSGYSPLHWITMLLRAPFGIVYLRGTTHVVVEMGVDGPFPPKNMEYLLSFVRPDIAVSLNVAATHTGYYEAALSQEEQQLPPAEKRDRIVELIAEDDTRIIRDSGCRVAIFNQDDSMIHALITDWAKTQSDDVRVLAFSMKDPAGGRVLVHHVSIEGTTFMVMIGSETIALSFPGLVLPAVYGENMVVALLVAQACGVSLEQAAESLSAHTIVPAGRSSVFPGVHQSTLIDSSYNASRAAIVPFLSLLSQIAQREDGSMRPRILLLGDMRELGAESEFEHLALVPDLIQHADAVYCVGEITRDVLVPALQSDGRIPDVQWFESSRVLGQWLSKALPEEAVVLVKGSQNTIFLEEAIALLLKNPADAQKLCRMEPYWQTIKEDYFRSLS